MVKTHHMSYENKMFTLKTILLKVLWLIIIQNLCLEKEPDSENE